MAKTIVVGLDNFAQSGETTLDEIAAVAKGENGAAVNIVRDPATGKVIQVALTLPDTASQTAIDAITNNPGVTTTKITPAPPPETIVPFDFDAAAEGATAESLGYVVETVDPGDVIFVTAAAALVAGSTKGLLYRDDNTGGARGDSIPVNTTLSFTGDGPNWLVEFAVAGVLAQGLDKTAGIVTTIHNVMYILLFIPNIGGGRFDIIFQVVNLSTGKKAPQTTLAPMAPGQAILVTLRTFIDSFTIEVAPVGEPAIATFSGDNFLADVLVKTHQQKFECVALGPDTVADLLTDGQRIIDLGVATQG